MTENHSYNIPEKGSTDWNVPLNKNFENLDTDVEVRDNEAELEKYVPKQGAKFFAVDTGAIYIGDGEEWTKVPFQLPSTTSDPTNAEVGRLWYRSDTDRAKLQTANGPKTLKFAEDESNDNNSTETETDSDVLIQMDGSSVLDHYTQFRGGDGNWTLDTRESVSESQSLHGWIHSGETWASNVEWDLASEGYDSNIDEWHQRFYFYIGDGFDMNSDDNCRIFNTAMAEGSRQAGGNGAPTGDDGWSERLYITERGSRNDSEWNLLSYAYHMDQGGSYGELTTIENVGLTTGEWHQIDCYCKTNTYSGGNANSDGVVRYWFDEELIYDRTDLRFTTTDDNRIQWGGPVLHYGGGYNAPTDVLTWYDDHEIWIDKTGPL